MSDSFHVSLCIVAVTFFVLCTRPASLMEISSNKSLELDKEMVIWCNVSEHSVKWSKDGESISSDDRMVVTGSKVTISRANRGDAGKYTCRIDGAEDSNMIKSTRIFVNTTAKFSAKSYNLEQGETLMLECKVDGDPLPRVTWFRDGEPLLADGGGIRVLPNDKGVENAKLEIADLDFEDRANYTCIAENDFSSAKASTFVRVKDKFAALWPFLGIVAEVIILVVIIFCYERKRAKSEEEDDADTPAAASRSTDGSKGDVRQRK